MLTTGLLRCVMMKRARHGVHPASALAVFAQEHGLPFLPLPAVPGAPCAVHIPFTFVTHREGKQSTGLFKQGSCVPYNNNCLQTFYCALIESQGDGIAGQEKKEKKEQQTHWAI